jgi:hypothetical protein
MPQISPALAMQVRSGRSFERRRVADYACAAAALGHPWRWWKRWPHQAARLPPGGLPCLSSRYGRGPRRPSSWIGSLSGSAKRSTRCGSLRAVDSHRRTSVACWGQVSTPGFGVRSCLNARADKCICWPLAQMPAHLAAHPAAMLYLHLTIQQQRHGQRSCACRLWLSRPLQRSARIPNVSASRLALGRYAWPIAAATVTWHCTPAIAGAA